MSVTGCGLRLDYFRNGGLFPGKTNYLSSISSPQVTVSYCFLPKRLTILPSISLSADNVASSFMANHKRLGRNFSTLAHHVCSLPGLSIHSTSLAVIVWEQSVFSQDQPFPYHWILSFLLTQGHHSSNFLSLSCIINFPLCWNIPISTKMCGYFFIVKKKKRVELIIS